MDNCYKILITFNGKELYICACFLLIPKIGMFLNLQHDSGVWWGNTAVYSWPRMSFSEWIVNMMFTANISYCLFQDLSNHQTRPVDLSSCFYSPKLVNLSMLFILELAGPACSAPSSRINGICPHRSFCHKSYYSTYCRMNQVHMMVFCILNDLIPDPGSALYGWVSGSITAMLEVSHW